MRVGRLFVPPCIELLRPCAAAAVVDTLPLSNGYDALADQSKQQQAQQSILDSGAHTSL